MNKLQMKLPIAAALAGLLSSSTTVAQILPPARRAPHVEITQAPALESARDQLTIIKWTTSNPGGLDDHFGVVHYGTDPNDLNQTAQNHVRLNRGHQETTFRVRLTGLAPRTTYYYRVTSVDGSGANDGAQSPILQFTTPARGEQIVSDAKPQK